jgi:NAD(P)H-hydrate epimerase
VIPIVTPEEMGAIDRAAPEPVEVLIARAGAAVARAALELLGGSYGRRVVVVAGKGNNGNDGREAARRLRGRGVRVVEVPAEAVPPTLPAADLVIDAAFGTGFRGTWRAPEVPEGMPVLAVDIPSGVDGVTGEVDERSRVLRADRTVTFAALKPGLLLGSGRALAGAVTVADIGLDVGRARSHVVTDGDVAAWWPTRPADEHKWRSAVWVLAGSPGMHGAAALVCRGAQRAGAGYVRLSTPGGDAGPAVPVEVVRTPLPRLGWWTEVRAEVGRFGALVVGNGLGRDPALGDDVRSVVAGSPVPVVLDADGLGLLGERPERVLGPDVVLTPHDGEAARLAGAPPGPDRLEAARGLAGRLGAIVLLKGGPTVVAHPDGRVLVVTSGDARLATAGTGDVLAGIIGALCARGMGPWAAAAAAAHLHGRAGALGCRIGLTADDLPDLLPAALEAVGAAGVG